MGRLKSVGGIEWVPSPSAFCLWGTLTNSKRLAQILIIILISHNAISLPPFLFNSPHLPIQRYLPSSILMALPSGSSPTLSLLLFISLLLLPLSPSSSLPLSPSQCLKVSSSQFVSSVSQVLHLLDQVVSVLSRFADFSGDSRLSHAISDCLDLLDSSSDDLSSSASASQSPQGKHNGTGNLSADLRTWLSAALVNPETCEEGFEGTNSIVSSLISAGLGQVTSLVQELLAQVHPVSGHSSSSNGGFPSWIKPGDRKLLQASGVPVDVVVASDGTGNYTKVMDAVLAAPDYSMKRYVIYVKRGVYTENVEIKKKKWNLMMIGDGMDATVISGNRSFVGGWTTFRTATFGKRAFRHSFFSSCSSLFIGVLMTKASIDLTKNKGCYGL